MGFKYTLAPGPSRLSKRQEMLELTGQRLYPAIEFEDGSWFRAESKDMETTIRDGKLMQRAQGITAPVSAK